MSISELIAKARKAFIAKDYTGSQDALESALKLEPSNDEAKQILALALKNQGDFTHAYEVQISVSEDIKKAPGYWLNLGKIHAGLGNTTDAISAFKKALGKNPKYTAVYQELLVLLEKQDMPDACKFLFQAIRYLGLTKEYESRLKRYQDYFSSLGGIQAPVSIKIKRNEGRLALQFKKLRSISEIHNLEIVSPVLVHLSLENNQIEKIAGLECLAELRNLSLGFNRIEKMEGLDSLGNLQSLNLRKNNIRQIEGLHSLRNLRRLNLNENQIQKIEGLENQKMLTSLHLEKNQISSLQGCEELTALTHLYLNDNQLKSLDGIEHLTNLKGLHLNGNKITEFCGLDPLTNLLELQAGHNQVSNMKGLENTAYLETLLLDHNQLTMVNNLHQMPNLKKLDLRGNPNLPGTLDCVFEDFEPLWLVKQLDGLRGDDLIQQISILQTKIDDQRAKSHEEMQLVREFQKIPSTITEKYRQLLKKNAPDKCLYCGQQVPRHNTGTETCRKRVHQLLLEANKKLPEFLRSEIKVDSEIYETVVGSKSRLIIKSAKKQKVRPTLFTADQYITPRGTICHKCLENFVARMEMVFDQVTGTKLHRKHQKMHEKIKTSYYKEFEAFIDRALK